MHFMFSLRGRLVFWFSLMFALLLSASGILTYFLVSEELHSNLDASLHKVANSINSIITKKDNNKENKSKSNDDDKFAIFREEARRSFIGPLRPYRAIPEKKEEVNDVWSAVYEHILFDQSNFYIQITDTSRKIIYRSQTLQRDTLPNELTLFVNPVHTSDSSKKQRDSSFLTSLWDFFGEADSLYKDVTIGEKDIRLYIKKTDQAIISVGYTFDEINSTLNGLFSMMIIAFPLALGLSALGGYFLSKLSLRRVDKIVSTADEITGTNLSRRLPKKSIDDEIGRLTDTINSMIERIETSFNRERRFTSDASHELKTPLTILRGELEIALLSDKSTEEYQVIIASALEEVLRLTNVVVTLLDLSRADSGRVQMNFEEKSLTKLLGDICEDAEILAESKNINIKVDLDEDVNLSMDSPRMHQALLNIIDNAIKYTPKNGDVTILLKKGANCSDVIVSDTGMGMDEDKLEQIFDRFFRLDKARSSNIQGTGLGLSIVKWILDAHKGEIEVKSKPNVGTTFKVTLPNTQA